MRVAIVFAFVLAMTLALAAAAATTVSGVRTRHRKSPADCENLPYECAQCCQEFGREGHVKIGNTCECGGPKRAWEWQVGTAF